MAENAESKPVFLHRSILVDGLRALLLTHKCYDGIINDDQFSLGYQQGFKDALLSLSNLCGLTNTEDHNLILENHTTIVTQLDSLGLNPTNRVKE